MSGSDESEADIPDEKMTETIDTDGTGEIETDGTPTEPIEVDSVDQFRDLINSYRIVLGYCYTNDCEHCATMDPIVEDLATRDDVVVAAIDAEANPRLGKSLDIEKIPSFPIFLEAEPFHGIAGVQDKAVFEDLFDELASE